MTRKHEWPPPLYLLVQCWDDWDILEPGTFAAKHSTMVEQLRQKLNVREYRTDSPHDVLRKAMLQYHNYAIGNRPKGKNHER